MRKNTVVLRLVQHNLALNLREETNVCSARVALIHEGEVVEVERRGSEDHEIDGTAASHARDLTSNILGDARLYQNIDTGDRWYHVLVYRRKKKSKYSDTVRHGYCWSQLQNEEALFVAVPEVLIVRLREP